MAEINKQEIRNFDYVQMCLHLTFDSLNELKILSKTRPMAEVKLIQNGPLAKYAISLQYVFVMEYTKLFESKKKGESSNHLASLEKLSYAILNKVGPSYLNTHNIVLERLDEIRQTKFFKKILSLRDSKYAHVDSKGVNSPFSIKALMDDEIEEGFQHLELVKQINDHCTGVFNYSFIFDQADDRTDNFISYQTKYMQHWFKTLRFS